MVKRERGGVLGGAQFRSLFSDGRVSQAFWTLMVMRVVYTLNWFNIGGIFSNMALDFHEGTLGLGELTGSFYLGLGLFQVPGGILTAKWGAKRVVVKGTMVFSFAALASGLVPALGDVIALRFVVGAGMALVFPPSVVILIRLLRRQASGLGVGLLNSAYDVGGFLALFVWGVLAAEFGWWLSLAASGTLGVASGVAALVLIPEGKSKSEFHVTLEGVRSMLLNRKLILIGFGLLSLTVGNGLIGSFMPFYLHQEFGMAVPDAGIIASLVVVVPIFSSVVGGRIYDRFRRPRLQMLLASAGMAGSLLAAGFNSVPAAIACSAIGGLLTGFGITTGFAGARDLHEGVSEYDSFAVAWVNGISLNRFFLASDTLLICCRRFGILQCLGRWRGIDLAAGHTFVVAQVGNRG